MELIALCSEVAQRTTASNGRQVMTLFELLYETARLALQPGGGERLCELWGVPALRKHTNRGSKRGTSAVPRAQSVAR